MTLALPTAGKSEEDSGLGSEPERTGSPILSALALFSEQAKRSPLAVAIWEGELALTYAELDLYSDALAGRLRRVGVGREQLVALCARPSRELVVAILAVLKSGAACVPLDPASPPERLAFMLSDCGASVLLTQESLGSSLPVSRPQTILIDALLESATGDTELPSAVIAVDQLAYVIYTSGSTGQPKGVAVTHRGLLNLAKWHVKAYAIGPDDCGSQLAGLGFDASVWELWPYLVSGASVRLWPDLGDPWSILTRLEKAGVTVAFLPTPLAEAAIDVRLEGRLRAVLTGGDLLRRVPPSDLGAELFNHYGPTEATVLATAGRVVAGEASPPSIGCEMDNASVQLLDAELCPVAEGEVGEICIGGAGLARGYLHRPGLTADCFRPNPAGSPGTRLYRSGDLGRRRPDGQLEFAGREDDQVKIRGHRVELGEIESSLMALDEVTAAVVLVQETQAGRRLVAYLSPAAGSALVPAHLRESLTARLPDYMLPSRYLSLPVLPLTANGKFDRRALMAEMAAASLVTKPAADFEATVIAAWEDALNRTGITAKDDFFHLGGYSLAAMKVLEALRLQTDRNVSMIDFFNEPTVAGLAKTLAIAPSSAPAKPIERRWPAELSPASLDQLGLWRFEQRYPETPTYNCPLLFSLAGRLDAERLLRALERVVARHESLRTLLVEHGGTAWQSLVDQSEIELEFHDLSSLSPSTSETEAERLVHNAVRRSFDLAQDCMLRAVLIRLADEDRLLLNIHHVAVDALSYLLLAEDLVSAYERPEESLPERGDLSYADYACWQIDRAADGELKEELDYWAEHLAGAPPLLELASAKPRPSHPGVAGALYKIELGQQLAQAVDRLAKAEEATPFMVLTAALEILLLRHSGQHDFVLGTAASSRPRVEVESIVGFFIHILPVRAQLDGEASFSSLVADVRYGLGSAYANQDVPLELIVERLGLQRTWAYAPLFQVVVTEEPGLPSLPFAGASSIRTELVDTGTAKYELAFMFFPSTVGLGLEIEYRSDLFDSETVAGLACDLVAILEAATVKPDLSLDELVAGAGSSQIVTEAALAQIAAAEGLLLSIWAELLGDDQIALDEDFFEIGGDSLIAAQVIARVHAASGVELTLRSLFENSTIAELAAVLHERSGGSLA